MNSVYVLNPDIALLRLLEKDEADKYGIPFDMKYPSVQNKLDAAQPNFEVRSRGIQYSGMVYNEFTKQMKPFLELINWRQPTERKPTGDLTYKILGVGQVVLFRQETPYYAPRPIIDSLAWQKLSAIAKQYYIPIESVSKERYKVGDFYADLAVPPRGTYGTLHYEKVAKNIKVNGQTSIIPANCARLLVRLRDGSLLELYHLNYSGTTGEIKLLYEILTRLITLEPSIAKTYFFSLALTVELLRPAYRFSALLKKGILDL